MKLDKRYSRGFLLGGLSLAFLVARLYDSDYYISFFLQFLIAMTVVTLLASFLVQAFSLARWKRMLVVSLLIISAVAWYIYPGLRTGPMGVVYSYQELVERSDVIVMGQYQERVRIWQWPDNSEASYLGDTRWVAILSRRPYFQSGPHECHDYLFNAQQYLKGDNSHSFVVSLAYRYKTGKPAVEYVKPPLDETILLFLPREGERIRHWTEPYMFKLEDDTLYVQSNLSWVRKHFPPITVPELMKLISEQDEDN